MEPSISINDLQINSPPHLFKNTVAASRIIRRRVPFFLSSLILVFVLGFLGEVYLLHERIPEASSPNCWVLENTCTETLHPHMCFATLSPVPDSEKTITQEQILEIALKLTAESLEKSLTSILGLFNDQDLIKQQKNELMICMEIIERTLHQLRMAKRDLRKSFEDLMCRRYGRLDLFLSIAVVDQEICLQQFHYLMVNDKNNEGQNHLKSFIDDLKIPTSRMVSSSLAMVKDMEKACSVKVNDQERTTLPLDGSQTWTSAWKSTNIVVEEEEEEESDFASILWEF